MSRPSRGEYRSIFTVLLDGPDFQRLSPEARWTFLALKLTAGSTGILVYPGMAYVLAERTGYTPDAVEVALAELAGAPGDWIEREGNVVWVVRQLEFEPSLSAGNGNHRGWVEEHLNGLPRLKVVERFRQRYANWLAGSKKPQPVATSDVPSSDAATGDGMGDGMGDTMPITTTRYNYQKQLPDTRNNHQTVAAGGGGYLTACVVALNTSLEQHPALAGTFRVVAVGTQEGTVTWEADGIPLDTATRVIRDLTTRYRPTPRNRQPASLRYFDAAVRDAHDRATLPAMPAIPSTSPKRAPRITA